VRQLSAAPFTLSEVEKRPVGRLADQQQLIRIAFHQPSEAEQRKGLLIPPGRIDIQGGDGAGTGTAAANSDRVDGRAIRTQPGDVGRARIGIRVGLARKVDIAEASTFAALICAFGKYAMALLGLEAAAMVGSADRTANRAIPSLK
jgi:hypothetical protein